MNNGYELNDFLTAENLNRLIEYNIDGKVNKAKKDMHLRGTIGEINGDVCDFYINNGTTPVPTKINTGLKLFQNDDAYALAINGNLSNLIIDSNVHNFERLFGYTFDNFKLIEGFQDSTEWSDAETPIIITDDNIYRKYRGQGVRNTIDTSSADFFYSIKNISESLDFTVFDNGGGSTTDDYIGYAFYLSSTPIMDLTGIVEIDFRDGSGDYYYMSTNWNSYAFEQGWNVLSFAKSDFTTSSSNWNDIVQIRLYADFDSGNLDEYITFGCICMFSVFSSGGSSITTSDLLGTSNQITVTNGGSAIVGSSDATISLPTNIYLGAGTLGRDSDNVIDFSTDNFIGLKTNSIDRLTLDDSGNIAIGTTDIESWGSGFNAIQLPYGAIMWGTATDQLEITNNSYWDGANYRYRSGGAASNIKFDTDGTITFQTTTTGLIDNPITWTDIMELGNSGEVTINSLTADRVIYANGSKELTSSTVSSSELAYISGLNQSLSTSSEIQVKELNIYQPVSNTGCELYFLNNTSISKSGGAKTYIESYANLNAGVALATWRYYNHFLSSKTLRAEFEVNETGYFAFKTGSSPTERFKISTFGCILVNQAVRESNSNHGAIGIKKGTSEPISSTADQITLFATTDTDTTIGLRTEAPVVSATPVADYTLPIKINGTTYNLLLELP